MKNFLTGVEDISLTIYDHHDNLTHNEIYFKNHKQFSYFTKVLTRNNIRFEVVSAYLRDKEIEEATGSDTDE